MNKNDYIIRPEKPDDYRQVEELVRECFWNVYRPGCLEHFVLHKLRGEKNFVSGLAFVMEKDGRLIGQNVFVKAEIKCDGGTLKEILTMGPICIDRKYQRKGFGKILLDYSLGKAAEAGYGAVCFEGNIEFYGKSGFTEASGFGIRYNGMPVDADTSFFLGKELIPGYLSGITGNYKTPEGYFVCDKYPEEFERYDSSFPEKVKLKLPGQLC